MSDTRQIQVLNTRPLPMGRELQRMLKQANIPSIFAPQITTQTIHPQNLTNSLSLDVDLNCLWIFISRTAVRRFCQELTTLNRHHFSPKGKIIAVGKGTQEELQAAFPELKICLPAKANSESLVLMPEFNCQAISQVVIVKGEGGRDLIQLNLHSRQIKFIEVNTYRREAVDYPLGQLADWLSSQFVLVTSLDIAASVLANLDKLPQSQKLAFIQKVSWLVLSDRIREYLTQQDIPSKHIFNCEQPDNSSIIKTIKQRLSENSE